MFSLPFSTSCLMLRFQGRPFLQPYIQLLSLVLILLKQLCLEWPELGIIYVKEFLTSGKPQRFASYCELSKTVLEIFPSHQMGTDS